MSAHWSPEHTGAMWAHWSHVCTLEPCEHTSAMSAHWSHVSTLEPCLHTGAMWAHWSHVSTLEPCEHTGAMSAHWSHVSTLVPWAHWSLEHTGAMWAHWSHVSTLESWAHWSHVSTLEPWAHWSHVSTLEPCEHTGALSIGPPSRVWRELPVLSLSVSVQRGLCQNLWITHPSPSIQNNSQLTLAKPCLFHPFSLPADFSIQRKINTSNRQFSHATFTYPQNFKNFPFIVAFRRNARTLSTASGGPSTPIQLTSPDTICRIHTWTPIHPDTCTNTHARARTHSLILWVPTITPLFLAQTITLLTLSCLPVIGAHTWIPLLVKS
jgi:pyrimidine deaminase RibD-like protein